VTLLSDIVHNLPIYFSCDLF